MYKVYEFKNFLTDSECNKFIKIIDINLPNARLPLENSKISDRYIDLKQTSKFYDRLMSFKERPNDIIKSGKHVFTAKYVPGTNFGNHTDTPIYFYDSNGNESNPLNYESMSKYTFFIYLNDNYSGGSTVFYPNSMEKITIVPEKGKAILFPMENYIHEGKTVTEGNKYWVGCQIIANIAAHIPDITLENCLYLKHISSNCTFIRAS